MVSTKFHTCSYIRKMENLIPIEFHRFKLDLAVYVQKLLNVSDSH